MFLGAREWIFDIPAMLHHTAQPQQLKAGLPWMSPTHCSPTSPNVTELCPPGSVAGRMASLNRRSLNQTLKSAIERHVKRHKASFRNQCTGLWSSSCQGERFSARNTSGVHRSSVQQVTMAAMKARPGGKAATARRYSRSISSATPTSTNDFRCNETRLFIEPQEWSKDLGDV